MKKQTENILILGAGVTGLSAGYASGQPVYEAGNVVGGICTSYYVKAGSNKRVFTPPSDENAYHFEIGGGHWIFGGDAKIKKLIEKLSPYKTYERKSSVYFPDLQLSVPYPLQNHLSYLGKEIADKALEEILNPPDIKAKTMKDWNKLSFGKTLSELFFNPFHELYTAGLYSRITPQDSYKSPIDREKVLNGYNGESFSVGYNTTFIYPKKGLDSLARKLSQKCKIYYGKKAVKINLKQKVVFFADKSFKKFDTLISTLPLNKMVKMTGINVGNKPFPSPSVLVINIGAEKGALCPTDHWIYIPKSKSGFHRVGFYSNVDSMFLPKKNRKKNNRVSIYVEKAFLEFSKISKGEIDKLSKQIIQELQDWKWIGEVEVCDPTWVETAYTWSWPNSSWREEVLKKLEKHGVLQVGRYGKWVFQGIADSISDGLAIGGDFKK